MKTLTRDLKNCTPVRGQLFIKINKEKHVVSWKKADGIKKKMIQGGRGVELVKKEDSSHFKQSRS